MNKSILKKINSLLKNSSFGPRIMLLIHTILIILVAIILGALAPDEETPLTPNTAIVDAATLKAPVKKKPKNKQAEIVDSLIVVDPVFLKVKELSETYKARNFDDLKYEYTYDLQKDLLGKTVLFYAYVSDIFKEGKDVYFQALKTVMNKNYYLKIKCDTSTVRILRNNGLFSYFVIKVATAEKIFINTITTQRGSRSLGNEARANSTPERETVLITGKCLATIKQE